MHIRNTIIASIYLLAATCSAELQIVFEEQQVLLSKSGKTLEKGEPEQVVLRLGADYFYTIRNGLVKAYDFQRRRILYLSDGKKIRETPFFAVVSERLEGFLGELETYKVLSQAGVLQEKDRYGIFQLESKYALQTDIRSSIRAKVIPSGAKRYSYNLDTDMIASLELSREHLLRQEVELFERFMLFECRLHPEIRKDMAVYRKVPQTLAYRTNVGSNRREVTLSLVSVKRVKDTVFAKEAREAPRPFSGELESIYREALDNAQQNAINGETYRKMFDASLERGFYLDAMLITVEVYLQTGTPTTASMQKLRPYLDRDQNLDRYLNGLDGSTPKSAAISLKSLEEIDRTNVFRQHVIDASTANALKYTNKLVAAEKKYFEAIRANPYLTGIYVDLGDLYYRMNLMDKAWASWEVAQDLFPQHPMLDIVYERNAFLQESFPEYF